MARRESRVTVLDAGSDRVSPSNPDSLSAWFTLYQHLEAGGNAESTREHKARDIRKFLTFFNETHGGDRLDDWTKPITRGFLDHIEGTLRERPTTINRRLATLKHAARWIEQYRSFLVGNPCNGIADLEADDPEWIGLTPMQMTRVLSAVEKLTVLARRRHQSPLRDRAVFFGLQNTAMRVHELLGLDLDQYQGKHFVNVKRKGKVRTGRVFILKDGREALDAYIEKERGTEPGPLFQTRGGGVLTRTQVDRYLKQIAAIANIGVDEPDQQVRLSAHVLRHSRLREIADRFGVRYAMEISGHVSSRYIWRYIRPSQAEIETMMEA